MESFWPYIEQHPKYTGHSLLERLVEPERVIMFCVSWVDDHGEVQVNRGLPGAYSTPWPSSTFTASIVEGMFAPSASRAHGWNRCQAGCLRTRLEAKLRLDRLGVDQVLS